MIKYVFTAVISGSNSQRQRHIELIAKRKKFYCVIPSKFKLTYFFFFDTYISAWKAKVRLEKEGGVLIIHHVTKTEVSEDLINAESQKPAAE